MYGLAFFLSAFAGCREPDGYFNLILKDGKATGIVIPKRLIKQGEEASLSIKLVGAKTDQAVLGYFIDKGSMIEFQPLIPLSPGEVYNIWLGNDEIGGIAIPLNKGAAPTVTAIYPRQDTLPENQLKIYISFSQPMQTGRALDYVSLLDSKGDTLQRVFLNLQPELWDTSGKVLTLWLDPGRIKRDLVLNRELGNPLHKTQKYRLVISDKWKDHRSIALAKPYTKQFIAGERDGEMPDISKWQIKTPKAGSDEPLIINVMQPLDHFLLQESIGVFDANGKMLYGEVELYDDDRIWKFKPLANWKPGHYQIKVQAKLEDLAGNNLNRIFDRDIRKDKQTNKEAFVRGLEVK